MKKSVNTWYCDFCFKSEHEAESLLAGPNNVAICNECIEVAVKSLEDIRAGKAAQGATES